MNEKLKITRRDFVKVTGAGLGGALLSSSCMQLRGLTPARAKIPEVKWKYSLCSNCMNLCPAKWKVEDGIVTEVKGNENAPVINESGGICAKGIAAIDRVYSPSRLKYPLKRIGERGEGKFKRITWDEALTEIATKLKKYRDDGHPESVDLAWGCPHQTTAVEMYRWWAKVYGTPNFDHLHGGSCYGSSAISGALTKVPGDMPDFGNAKVGVLLAAKYNSGTIGPGGVPWNAAVVTKGIKNGMKLYVVDPCLNETACLGTSEWVPIEPYTDTAFLLSLMNVIIKERLHDVDCLLKHSDAPCLIKEDGFPLKSSNGKRLVWDTASKSAQPMEKAGIIPALVGTYTINGIQCKTVFQLLTERVQEYPPEKAAQICKIPAVKIIEIGRSLGRNKPKSFIDRGPATASLYVGCFQKYRCQYILNLLLGNIDKPGGYYVYDSKRLDVGIQKPAPAAGKGEAVEGWNVPNISWDPDSFPLNGINMPRPIAIHDAVVHGKPYPIKAMIAVAAGTFFFDRSMAEEMLKNLEFFVVVDNFPNEHVDWADIVLPDAHFLERLSLKSQTRGYRWVGLRDRVIEPPAEVKPWSEVLIKLGKMIGLPGFDFTVEEWYALGAKKFGLTVDDFRKTGIYHEYKGMTFNKLKNWRGTIFPDMLAERYSDPKHAYYKNPNVNPVVQFDNPVKRDLSGNEFKLITGKTAINAQTSSTNNRLLAEDYLDGELKRHRAWINQDRADKLGIKNGESIWVEGEAGAKAKIRVKVTEAIHPSAIFIWWGFGSRAKHITADKSKHGINPNDIFAYHEEPFSGAPVHCQQIVKVYK